MGTLMKENRYLAGMDLLRQDYLSAVSELDSTGGLSKPRLDLLRTELAEEHRHRCTQEWRAISSQIKADLDV
jgi:hypothetical protein